ncbi:hypothetical protein BASA60_003810 [Batrachochytrium salamandrivorans]|nr:hypothetical protein BASA60_003810 [Batrachochytrium salamandrivorans]
MQLYVFDVDAMGLGGIPHIMVDSARNHFRLFSQSSDSRRLWAAVIFDPIRSAIAGAEGRASSTLRASVAYPGHSGEIGGGQLLEYPARVLSHSLGDPAYMTIRVRRGLLSSPLFTPMMSPPDLLASS